MQRVTRAASNYVLALDDLFNNLDLNRAGAHAVRASIVTNVTIRDTGGNRQARRHIICVLKRMNNHMSKSQGYHVPLIWLRREDVERSPNNPDGYNGVILDTFMTGVEEAMERYEHFTNLF